MNKRKERRQRMELYIREMKESDWQRVYEIYRQGMETNLATFQVEEMTFEEFSRERLPVCRFVILDNNKLIGWTTLKAASEIPEYHGVAEVSIYIDEKHRGKGAAKKLLEHLIYRSEAAGFWTLESDIFANNQASIQLHETCGFRKVGYREKIGRDQFGVWRDTVLLERRSDKTGV